MQFYRRFFVSALLAGLPAFLSAQAPPAPAAHPAKGMPPRASAAEYAGHGQAGAISIGADFDAHLFATQESTLSTEDYVAVEVGIFGAPGAHVTISANDFLLNINGKKNPLPVEGLAVLRRNLRDPAWTPPEDESDKDKPKSNSLNAVTNQADSSSTPGKPPVKIPPELERSMVLQVQNAVLPEGDRALPVSGLIFFRYTGVAKKIHSVELLYNGPAGKATIVLQR